MTLSFKVKRILKKCGHTRIRCCPDRITWRSSAVFHCFFFFRSTTSQLEWDGCCGSDSAEGGSVTESYFTNVDRWSVINGHLSGNKTPTNQKIDIVLAPKFNFQLNSIEIWHKIATNSIAAFLHKSKNE